MAIQGSETAGVLTATREDDRERDAREREARNQNALEGEARNRDALEGEARNRDAREREARNQDALEREARNRDALEREARNQDAREREARNQNALEREARNRDALEREARNRDAREREARNRDAREREARKQGAPASETRKQDVLGNAAPVALPKEEIVARLFEAFSRHELPSALELMHPDVVFQPMTAAVTRAGEPYRGHEGIRSYVADVERHWRRLTIRPKQIRAAGRAVVALGLVSGSGVGGSFEDAPTTWVVKFKDGLVAHVQIFSDERYVRGALAATGTAGACRPASVGADT